MHNEENFAEYEKAIKEELEKAELKNQQVLGKVKEIVSFEVYKEIEELIEDLSENVGNFYLTYEIITGAPSGNPQDDGFSGGDVYINQSCGITGDDFSGTHSIPLPNQQWLVIHF